MVAILHTRERYRVDIKSGADERGIVVYTPVFVDSFNPDEAIDRVRKLFWDIPAGQPMKSRTAQPGEGHHNYHEFEHACFDAEG